MLRAARRQLRPTTHYPRADLRAKTQTKTPPSSTCPWASAPALSQTARRPHRRGGARAQSERGMQAGKKRRRRALRSAPASTRLWRSASRGGPWQSCATLCSARAHTTLTPASFQTRRVAGTAERRSSAPRPPDGTTVCGVAVRSVRCAMYSNVMAPLWRGTRKSSTQQENSGGLYRHVALQDIRDVPRSSRSRDIAC